MKRQPLTLGRKNSENLLKKAKISSTGAGKNLKKVASDNKPQEQKSRMGIVTKSYLIKRTFPPTTDNTPKKSSEPTLKNKTAEKPLERTRLLVVKKESATQKTALAKKEVGNKKLEPKHSSSNKNVKKTIPIKEKSSADSEFKRKFSSILHKGVIESKTLTPSQQKSSKVAAKPLLKSSIFNTKANEKPTLQIEAWDAVQAPKPLFNFSKTIKRSNGTEKKSVPEKTLPRPESLMRRISKQLIAEKPTVKPNVAKIWKF